MKTKRFLALVLTICMIGGMLPTVFAADAEPATIVYDFSTAALLDYATPNKSVKYTLVNNYKINPEVSASWRYTSLINEGSVAFQPDGMCFYTSAKTAELNSNAVVLTIEVPASGEYILSVEHAAINYGEKTDVYMLRKDFATANNINLSTIEGVRAGIAMSSMTNPAADVKHIAAYDTHPNATVEDVYPEKINLTEGEYYLVAVANEGSVNYTEADRTYGMLSKLIFEPYIDESKRVWTYDFSASAFSNYSGSGNIDRSAVNNYTLDRKKSTGYWTYEVSINENLVKFYADALYFYTPEKSAPLNSNAVIFTLTVEVDGTFAPSVERTAVTYGEKTDLYLIKKDFVALKNIDISAIEGVQAAIEFASMTNPDADVKYIASYDTHPNATVEDAYPEVVNLTAGDYYLIAVANEGSVNYAAEARTYGVISKLMLTPCAAPIVPEKPAVTVSFGVTNNVNGKINIMGNSYKRGDEIELSAEEIEGYSFRCWVRGTEENGEIVSTDADFTYKLITNTYLTAVYTEDTTENTVEFYGGNGEYISTVAVVDGVVTAPSAPSLTGFKFLDWYTAKDKKLSETALDKAITRAVAMFEDEDKTFSVDGEENLKYDAKITRTSATPVVWYRDGIRVGYGTEYIYHVWNNVSKITNAAGSAQPLVALDGAVKDGAYMIEYDAGGKSIVEVGILFGDGDDMTVDSCMYKATSKKTAEHGQFTAKPAKSAYANARGYMIYLDGNDYKVVYSD